MNNTFINYKRLLSNLLVSNFENPWVNNEDNTLEGEPLINSVEEMKSDKIINGRDIGLVRDIVKTMNNEKYQIYSKTKEGLKTLMQEQLTTTLEKWYTINNSSDYETLSKLVNTFDVWWLKLDEEIDPIILEYIKAPKTTVSLILVNWELIVEKKDSLFNRKLWVIWKDWKFEENKEFWKYYDIDLNDNNETERNRDELDDLREIAREEKK